MNYFPETNTIYSSRLVLLRGLSLTAVSLGEASPPRSKCHTGGAVPTKQLQPTADATGLAYCCGPKQLFHKNMDSSAQNLRQPLCRHWGFADHEGVIARRKLFMTLSITAAHSSVWRAIDGTCKDGAIQNAHLRGK